jgi:thymidylate synthase
MKQYLDLCEYILKNGEDRPNRTGIDTRGIFGYQMRFNLEDGFPAITTKKLAWKAVVSELLWFLEGSDDERRLAEILHNTRDKEKTTIWTANAQADYWKPKAKFDGDVGRIYGVQWRKWKKYIKPDDMWSMLGIDSFNYYKSYAIEYIDQIKNIINKIKTDPYDRRMILTAWNPAEIEEMALPPCHVMSQFYVSNNKLSCQMYQRSVDVFIGLPFNIASYALLTHMIAHVTNLNVGEFIWIGGDIHIYHNHLDAINEQLTRKPHKLPKLYLNENITDIDSFSIDDIKLIDYVCDEQIKAPMAI